MTNEVNIKKEEVKLEANNVPLMKPPKHIKDKTIFYKYSGYLKDLIGEGKQNGSMG
jgi:hypothetical protein